MRVPARLRDETVQAEFAALGADMAVVAAYGLILPRRILNAPRLGCLNVHASLLPRWRGAAPIQRALLAGDPETGITIMQMEEGLDTGPILMQQALPIGPEATAASLDRSAGAAWRRTDRDDSGRGAAGPVDAAAAACRGGHLRAQDHPRRGPARLAAAGGGIGTAGARARPVAGGLL